MTALLARVRALIERLAPEPVCDTCIAERLALPVAEHAHHKILELAGEPGFERRLAPCVLCGTSKKVIYYKAK